MMADSRLAQFGVEQLLGGVVDDRDQGEPLRPGRRCY